MHGFTKFMFIYPSSLATSLSSLNSRVTANVQTSKETDVIYKTLDPLGNKQILYTPGLFK